MQLRSSTFRTPDKSHCLRRTLGDDGAPEGPSVPGVFLALGGAGLTATLARCLPSFPGAPRTLQPPEAGDSQRLQRIASLNLTPKGLSLAIQPIASRLRRRRGTASQLVRGPATRGAVAASLNGLSASDAYGSRFEGLAFKISACRKAGRNHPRPSVLTGACHVTVWQGGLRQFAWLIDCRDDRRIVGE
jgi:hypothetical protein